jgi:hypothetical protein
MGARLHFDQTVRNKAFHRSAELRTFHSQPAGNFTIASTGLITNGLQDPPQRPGITVIAKSPLNSTRNPGIEESRALHEIDGDCGIKVRIRHWQPYESEILVATKRDSLKMLLKTVYRGRKRLSSTTSCRPNPGYRQTKNRLFAIPRACPAIPR